MKKQLLAAMVLATASTTAFAIDAGDFTRIEYHVPTGVGSTMPYAPNDLTNKFTSKFNFLEFEQDGSEKLVTYLDTPDRDLRKNNIIIRVREAVTKPSKTKITVKVRGTNPEKFGKLKGYTKTEIDTTKGKLAYSVSYDIPYNPTEIDVQDVDIDKVIKVIKKNKSAWKVVAPFMKRYDDELIQTIVMRTIEWDSELDDPRFAGLEVEYAVWTPYYRRPRISFHEFSFKGNLTARKYLDSAFNYLNDNVQALDLQGDLEGSKTKATFAMTPAFQK